MAGHAARVFSAPRGLPSVPPHLELQGFPLCQTNEIPRAAQRLDSLLVSFLFERDLATSMRICVDSSSQVRTDKLQPVIEAAWLLLMR